MAGESLSVRQPTGAFVKFSGHSGNVLSVGFSLDGRLLASGGADRTVRVWSTEDGAELAKYPHAAPVRAVAFSADARALFTATADGQLLRWTAPVI